MTSQTDLVQASEASRVEVVAAADDAAQVIRDLNPELTLELSDVDGDRWSGGCSEPLPQAGEGPSSIQWISKRTFYVEPRQPTEPLIDPIGDELTRRGWVAGSGTENPEQRIVWLSRGDVSAAVAGTTTAEPGRVSPISVTVYGPCIAAPDGLDDGKPAAP